MAASSSSKRAGKFHRSFDVTATADGDTGLTITHGLATRPGGLAILSPDTEIKVDFEPLLSTPASLSGWSCTARGATTFTLAKTTATGSGNASPQVRVHVSLPKAFG